MSFKVLVIPEDPTNNGYILKPVVEAVMAEAGKPHAKVTVLTNPRLEGYDQAKGAIRGELLDRYWYVDLWIFIPDADRATPGAMRELEEMTAAKDVWLLCCPIKPEVEILACVARRREMNIDWMTARQHPHFKEKVFDPHLAAFGNRRAAGQGRAELTREGLQSMRSLFELVPELGELCERIRAASAG